jgi:hypothetical protein
MREELKNFDGEMLHVEPFYVRSLSAVWAELVSHLPSAIETDLFHSFIVLLVEFSRKIDANQWKSMRNVNKLTNGTYESPISLFEMARLWRHRPI